jgi:hypothetical protein
LSSRTEIGLVASLLVGAVVLVACEPSNVGQSVSADRPAEGSKVVWDDGCAGSRMYTAPAPRWSTKQGLDRIPWLRPLPESAGVVGFFWPHQPYLVPAGHLHSDGAANKILWVAQTGGHLTVKAHPIDRDAPVVSFDLGSSGFQWPSSIDLPSAGCWTLTLTWSNKQADVNVRVSAPAD